MPTTTPILHLPYPVPDDSVDVPRDVQALAEALDHSSLIFSGLAAARPAANTVPDGARYFATDSQVESITFGDTWYNLLPADGSITSAKIADGTIARGDMNNASFNGPLMGSLQNYTRMAAGQVNVPASGNTVVNHGLGLQAAMVMLTPFGVGNPGTAYAVNYDIPNSTQVRIYNFFGGTLTCSWLAFA